MAVARERCEAARELFAEGGSGGADLLASCSDDFTLYLWRPEHDKKPLVCITFLIN